MTFSFDNSSSPEIYIAVSPLGRVFLVTALAITTIAIIVGNSLVLAVLHKQRKIASQRVVSVFLANLAVLDISIALLIMPISISTYINGRWLFGEVLCEINGFATMLAGIGAILSMTAIAVDRYRIIVLPIGNRLHPEQAWRTLVFLWIWSAVQSMPPLLGWNRYSWGPSSSVCRASFAQRDGYIELIAFTSYIIPLNVMIYCYVKVYLTVRQSRRKIEMWARFTQDVWLRAEARTAKIVFTVLTVFIVCWTPFVLVYAINGTGKVSVPQEVFIVTGYMASTHSACNPVIYLAMNSRFRKDLILVIGCKRRSRPSLELQFIRKAIPQPVKATKVRNIGAQEGAKENHAVEVHDNCKYHVPQNVS